MEENKDSRANEKAPEKVKRDPHVHYHPLMKCLNEKFGEDLTGWECIEFIEKYAALNPEIKIVWCDDSMFSTSLLVLVPHPEMGISVLFIPQLTTKTDNFFLYPNHQLALVKALSEMKIGGWHDNAIRFEDKQKISPTYPQETP